jgi:hypothetical protein
MRFFGHETLGHKTLGHQTQRQGARVGTWV